jgi:hypothetical protein
MLLLPLTLFHDWRYIRVEKPMEIRWLTKSIFRIETSIFMRTAIHIVPLVLVFAFGCVIKGPPSQVSAIRPPVIVLTNGPSEFRQYDELVLSAIQKRWYDFSTVTLATDFCPVMWLSAFTFASMESFRT